MTRKSLQVPLSLPDDPHGPATFAHTVERRLSNRLGIYGVRVWPSSPPGQKPAATIELDYDPDLLSLAQIERYVQQAGGSLDESIGHLVLPIEGVLTPQNAHTVQTVLNRVPGVTTSVSFAAQTLRVEFDRHQCALPEIVRRLDKMGLHLRPDPALTAAPRSGTARTAHRLPGWMTVILSQRDLRLSVAGGVLLMAGLMVHLLAVAPWLRLGFLAGSYVCCGWYTAPDVVKALRQRRLDIDVLMLAAALGAAYLGHYEEGALLLLLFSLGNAGQRLAMSRARGAIQALARLAPQTATVTGPDGEREVRVQELRVGDDVLVRPGQSIPADGTVKTGYSTVDQSPITGESMPIEKRPGNEVFAGTINGEGELTVHVMKPSHENTITRVIRLVEEAQTTKSPTQLFTDRVERWYVPIVLATTAVLIIVPPLLGVAAAREQSLWAGWFYQAMAFLTAASPCALAIGTPAAVLSGVARAARTGVLVKGGAQLENLGRVSVVAFDKTGTLTTGRPQVTDVVHLVEGIDPIELLSVAAAVERHSHHPLAVAITAEADARDCPRLMARQIEQVPGMGIWGTVDDGRVFVGRLALLENRALPIGPDGDETTLRQRLAAMESQGKTVVVIYHDGAVTGMVGIADQPRPAAAAMISHLKQLGIRWTVLLTGDNNATAAAVAKAVGIDESLAELLPQDKLQKVRQLTAQFGRVAMVGDGVNDAPAMATSTVGIAIGGASGGGSDVALETADVALLADDLNKLPEAIAVSRYTRRIIVQNLVLALGVILVLAPLAALGYTTIYASVMFHEGSTIVVVLNALRILEHRTN